MTSLSNSLRRTHGHPKEKEAEELGWIPHYTLPLNLIENKEGEKLDLAIMFHYRDKWLKVREELERETDKYLIDEHTKNTMKEALQAHSCKLYHLVTPTLLVSIESAVRIHLNKNTVEQRLDVKEKILRGFENLPVSNTRNLSSEMIQYETIKNHVYKHINNEADRADLSENQIPNRHAAIHGLVLYASEKTSLNSIFLADFTFHTITEIKQERVKELTRILNDQLTAKKRLRNTQFT